MPASQGIPGARDARATLLFAQPTLAGPDLIFAKSEPGQVPDADFPAAGPVYQTGVKWLPGLAGESRSGDANGQYIRVEAGGGPGGTVVIPSAQTAWTRAS